MYSRVWFSRLPSWFLEPTCTRVWNSDECSETPSWRTCGEKCSLRDGFWFGCLHIHSNPLWYKETWKQQRTFPRLVTNAAKSPWCGRGLPSVKHSYKTVADSSRREAGSVVRIAALLALVAHTSTRGDMVLELAAVGSTFCLAECFIWQGLDPSQRQPVLWKPSCAVFRKLS